MPEVRFDEIWRKRVYEEELPFMYLHVKKVTSNVAEK
jgi:hypothetical protein